MTFKFTSIFIGLLLLIGCKVHENVKSIDKKKVKWLESLVVDEGHYQVVVTVPKSDAMAENAEKAEKEGRFKMAAEIERMLIDSYGKLITEIIVGASEKEMVRRFRQDEIAKGILNMEIFSSYKSSNEYSVCYRINKTEYEKLREEEKRKAVNLSIDHLSNARTNRSNRNPLEAAKEYSDAFIAIQEYLHEPIDYIGEGEIKNIDKVIFDEMMQLRSEMSIKCDPEKEVLLNQDNGYTGIISFEVLQDNEKTGKLNVSIDVAGLRNESILVNGYSVLVGNLPSKMGYSFVSIRSDLFEHLRANGNGFCSMIYQKLGPITEKILIKKVYPIMDVQRNSESDWDKIAFDMFSSGIKASSINFEQNEFAARLKISPEIKYSEVKKPGHVKITGQWILNFGNGLERYVGEKIILTETSKDKAIKALESKLNSNLTSTVLPDLTQLLEE